MRGFSLIELLMAVLIVAILGAVAVPTYTRYTTKARRAECTDMLSVLRSLEAAYVNENSYSYNRIYCPKDSGLHVITDSGESVNVLTLPLSEKNLYCMADGDADGFPDPITATNYDFVYQFQLCGGKWDQSDTNLSNTSDTSNFLRGPGFVTFGASTTNVYGFSNTDAANWTQGACASTQYTTGDLEGPATNMRYYYLKCSGNIDDDGTLDVVWMDTTGKTWVETDDVKN